METAIHKCYINCFNILNYRGLNIHNLKNISYNNFKDKYNYFSNNPNILDIYVENKDKKILIHFIQLEENNSGNLSKISERIISIYNNLIKKYSFDDSKPYELIFILLNDIGNDNIKNICDKFNNLTIFFYKNIIVDIMNHNYVPKHILLNDKEKLNLKKDLHLESYDLLPYINRYDPIAKILGLKYGDVCKIIRNNPYVSNSIYYRYCWNMDM